MHDIKDIATYNMIIVKFATSIIVQIYKLNLLNLT